MKDLDATLYAKSEYNCDQMREIRIGLMKNLDVSAYAKPEFTSDQMEVIRLGLANALDNTPKKMDL